MSFLALIAIVVFTFSFVSAFFLFLKPERSIFKNKTLGLSLMFYSIFFLAGFLWYQLGYIVKSPHLIRTINPLMFFTMPLFYFYVRNTVKGIKGVQRYDWIHFLPGLFHFIELIPFYMMSYQEKLDIAQQLIESPNLLDELASGIIPGVYVDFVRIVLQLTYLVASCKLILNLDPKFFFDINSLKLKNWLFVSVFWMGILVFSHTGYFVLEVMGNYGIATFSWIANLFAIGILSALTALTLYINFHPEWVYSETPKGPLFKKALQKIKNIEMQEAVITVDESLEYAESSELDVNLIEIKTRIENLFVAKVYMEHDLSASDFAEKIEVSPRQLSTIIRKIYGKGYKELINFWRVQAAIELIEAGYLSNRTIESLCKEVGFNSRITFFNVFKKEIGIGPSDYFEGKVNEDD